MLYIRPNDCRCKFCGKGPFKSYAALHRHISNTVACQRKSRHDFRAYAGGIWEEWPTFRPDAEPLRDPSPEQDMSLELVDIEVDNFDFSLEDDRVYGDPTYAASANPQPQSSRLIFTSEKWDEKEQLGQYIE